MILFILLAKLVKKVVDYRQIVLMRLNRTAIKIHQIK